VCRARRRADDHLSLVAGMRRDQTRKLVAAGIVTTTALAEAPADRDVDGLVDATYERLHAQAALQVRNREHPPYLYELLEPEPPEVDGQPWPKRGFAALPEPSSGDLFFDIESDPYALDGGLEYLFGVVEVTPDGPHYHGFWAHDREQERVAFEQVIDFVMARLDAHPDLHVYHYAQYEPSAIKRLMGRHGTREAEVDELLRGKRFVDLFAVVRQGVRIGSESYSLKQVEKLYMHRDAGEVMDGGGSIVVYERWLDEPDPAILEEIRAYNEDDCTSTVLLRDWLEARRVDAEARFGPIPRPGLLDGEASEELSEREAMVEALAARLTADVPAAGDARTAEQHARWLLAQLLSWHRREEKPAWWMYFHRLAYLTDEDFTDDRECIGGLELVGPVGAHKRSTIFCYRFEPQDHKFSVGSTPHDPRTGKPAGEVMEVDDALGRIDLKRGPSLAELPHPRALVPREPVRTDAQKAALVSIAEWVLAHGIDAPGDFRAVRHLLLREPPRIHGDERAAPLVRSGEDGMTAARRCVAGLDESVLAVQGPPGSGKTYTGAHMIVDLLAGGKTVGITAHSHAAIGNLLRAALECCDVAGLEPRAVQRSDEDDHCGDDRVQCAPTNPVFDALVAEGDVRLMAGTTWLWAREEMRSSVDVLFVDEAGQKSLAEVVAIGGAPQSIVLLGDPQQLAQPSTGSHPEGAEVSALEHLLDGGETMPPELGLFLETTHRMHPTICEFISEVAYDGKLRAEPGLERQSIGGFAGLRWEPVEHEGNRSSSPEEAARVAELIDELIGQAWTDKQGVERALTLADVLVVTPYNAQVAKLRQALPDGARIGTVDKFQGQEAPVTIYSMATSTADDVPRGMDFLYDLHRLNVAVSRAEGETVVVCSPALLRVMCRNAEQLRLANALCRFAQTAGSRLRRCHRVGGLT
jgi:uncharacterized protein